MELAFWTLDQVDEYLAKYYDQKLNNLIFADADDELWIGWIIGRFLTGGSDKKYLIGLPLRERNDTVTLSTLAKRKLIVQDINWDVGIINEDDVPELNCGNASKLFRIQIKRYRNKKDPNFDDFLRFMENKLKHYAPDNNLNFVFHIKTGFLLDIERIRGFSIQNKFEFGSVWIYGPCHQGKLNPFLMQIYPALREGIPFFRPTA